MEGKQYRHKNGAVCTVLFLTNTDSTPERLLTHPIDVIYMGQNGKKWSRPLSDWDRSFTEINILSHTKSEVSWEKRTPGPAPKPQEPKCLREGEQPKNRNHGRTKL